MKIKMTIELPIANTNTIIKKKRRFATPIVSSVFHKDSHPRKSILYTYHFSRVTKNVIQLNLRVTVICCSFTPVSITETN